MSEKEKKSIFRPEAVARYMDQKQEPVFPKIIGPRLFPKLWVLILLLFAGLLLVAWVPVNQSLNLKATLLPTKTAPRNVFLVLPPQAVRLEEQSRIQLQLNQSQPLRGRVQKISALVDKPENIPANYRHLRGNLSELSWPLHFATIQMTKSMLPPNTPVPVDVRLLRDPIRLIDYLPGL